MIEDESSKWGTCNTEAKGFILDRKATAGSALCKGMFRKCCMNMAIKNARDEAIEEALEEEEVVVIS